MSNFKWMDNRSLDPDKPYDAFAVQRLLENTNYVFQNRGNHAEFQWDTRTTNIESKHFRPFCSVTKWLTILRVPYFISPGLKTLKCSLLSRVSNDNLYMYPDLGMNIRVSIDTDTSGSGGITLLPRQSLGSAVWTWDEFDYEVGEELLTGFGGNGGMGYLNVEIKSNTPARIGDLFGDSSGKDHDYMIDIWSLDASSGGDLMVSNQADFFEEGNASLAPDKEANEACAFAVLKKIEQDDVADDDEFRITGIYDNVFRYFSLDDTEMRVDGIPFTYTGDQWGMKIVAAYIQPVTFEFVEVYQ